MSNFTVRVYGLIVHQSQLLVVDEWIAGRLITKFPGGGLEFGEGTRDCLKRELKEELGINAQIGEHFYTTDFFQQSNFHAQPLQVLSIYYRAYTEDIDNANLMALSSSEAQIENLRWLPVNTLSTHQLSLPIDKVVVEMMLKN
jgi:8-oxo-dGTP diphosphatase